MSAVMAKAYDGHLKRISSQNYIQGLRDQQWLLLFRVTHAVNQQQELSAPMVVSYIMGWGDVMCSHHYSPIYWSTFIRMLLENHPTLRRSNDNNRRNTNVTTNQCEEIGNGSIVSNCYWLYFLLI